MNKNNVKVAEELNNKLKDIDLKLSELRKAGLDTKIAELKKMSVKSKIKMAEITGERSDIEKVDEIFKSIEKEMIEISESQIKKKAELIEDKEEEDDKSYVKMEAIKRVYKLIENISGYLDKKEYSKAVKDYLEIREIYKILSKKYKKPIYSEIQNIYKKIINSGAVKV